MPACFGELPERDRQTAFDVLVERSRRLRHGGRSASSGPRPAPTCSRDGPPRKSPATSRRLQSDDAAALIDDLPEDLSRSVLDLMRGKQDTEVEDLLEYPEHTAGRIMNPNVFALSEDLTVGEAITALQGARDVEMVFYLYTVDERNHLVGVTSLRRLLLVAPETPLKRIVVARCSACAWTRTRRKWRGRSPPTTCWRFLSWTSRTSWPA